jgi:hypothetical protein
VLEAILRELKQAQAARQEANRCVGHRVVGKVHVARLPTSCQTSCCISAVSIRLKCCKVALALVTGRAARGQQVCGAQSFGACARCQAADKLSEALLQLCTDVLVQQEGGCVSLPLVLCCVECC